VVFSAQLGYFIPAAAGCEGEDGVEAYLTSHPDINYCINVSCVIINQVIDQYLTLQIVCRLI